MAAETTAYTTELRQMAREVEALRQRLQAEVQEVLLADGSELHLGSAALEQAHAVACQLRSLAMLLSEGVEGLFTHRKEL